MTDHSFKQDLILYLAAPRGFCAGVDRAIQIVELAIKKFGSPVFVRHEIVHNKYVVRQLENLGAVFIEDLDQAPDDRPVIFSAHGVPKSVPSEAERRNLIYLDATCPLVSKVHREVEQLAAKGYHILMIGHAGHPEVIGTMGQTPAGTISLIETIADAQSFEPDNPSTLAYVTQTTLSVDDTAEIVNTLRTRFPAIAAPKKEDICYATTNRQEAVKDLAAKVDRLLVVGAPNSSNSLRLVEVGLKAGCDGKLIQRAEDIDLNWLSGAKAVGITAGASAPEILVQEVITLLKETYNISVKTIKTVDESVIFKVPSLLKDIS